MSRSESELSMRPVAIHVLMVNFHQSTLCAASIRALLQNNYPALAFEGISLHIHWIDNEAALHDPVRESLALQLKELVQTEHQEMLHWHLHCFEQNLGFGRACQKIFEQLPAEDCLLLLNPDTKLEGLGLMVKALLRAGDRVAGVGPQSFWDEAFEFFLPPTPLIDASFITSEAMAQSLPSFAHHRSRQFRKAAIELWQASQLTPVAALSGACALLRIDALKRCGGLFDPAYFMYWEDSDLMMRLNRNGYTLYIEPAARLIHAYTHHPAKSAMIEAGRKIYGQRWDIAPWWDAAHWPKRSGPSLMASLVVPIGTDLMIDAPDQTGTILWEFSLSADFVPSIGRFARDFQLPWSLLSGVASVSCFVRRISPARDDCWAITIADSSTALHLP